MKHAKKSIKPTQQPATVQIDTQTLLNAFFYANEVAGTRRNDYEAEAFLVAQKIEALLKSAGVDPAADPFCEKVTR